MPHKRNPIAGEQHLRARAPACAGYALAALENVALWHERDISHSSVERVILPDATSCWTTCCGLTTFIVGGWTCDPARMRREPGAEPGPRVLAARAPRRSPTSGHDPTGRIRLVQRNAMLPGRRGAASASCSPADPASTGLEPARSRRLLRIPAWFCAQPRRRSFAGPAWLVVDEGRACLVRLKRRHPGRAGRGGAARARAALGFADVARRCASASHRGRRGRADAGSGARPRGRDVPQLLANPILEDYTIEAVGPRLAPPTVR